MQQGLQPGRVVPPVPRPELPPNAGRVAASGAHEPSLLLRGTDVATDFIPWVSNAKDFTTAVTGVNPVTGEKVGTFGRVMAGVFAIPAAGNVLEYVGKGGKYVLKGGKAAYEAIEVARAGSKVAKAVEREAVERAEKEIAQRLEKEAAERLEKEAAQRGEKEAAEATGKQTAPLAKDGEKTAAASGGKEAAAGAAAKPPKPPIARIAPGSLPAAEEAAVLDTIPSIESGTKPSGALGKKWGTKFKNYNGDLPGKQGVESPYKEYRVAPQPGQAAPGPNRIVVNTETGEMYYSWTHYGDTWHPAFVKIR